jgi:hypothetical protein
VRLGQSLLGPDDALRDGGLRHQVGAGDLGRGQPAEQAQCQRDPGRDGQDGMAGGEDQPQQVVVDLVRRHLAELRRAGSGRLQVPADQRVLALQFAVAAEQVDGAPLGHGHQPGARIARDAGGGPLLQRGDDRVLGQFLGQAHVARVAGQPRDQPGPLDPDHRVDRRMGIRPGHYTMTPSGARSGQRLRPAWRAWPAANRALGPGQRRRAWFPAAGAENPARPPEMPRCQPP